MVVLLFCEEGSLFHKETREGEEEKKEETKEGEQRLVEDVQVGRLELGPGSLLLLLGLGLR